MELKIHDLIVITGKPGLYRMLAKKGANMRVARLADGNVIGVDTGRSKSNYLRGFKIDLADHTKIPAFVIVSRMLKRSDLPSPD